MELDNEKQKDSAQKVNTEKIPMSKNKKIIIIVSVIAVLLLIFISSTIFALVNIGNTKIISKVTINGIDIGKLTKEEAIKKLEEVTNQKVDNDILIKANDFEYEIKLSQIEVKYDIEKAINEAYNIGRRNNIFSNNYEIMKTVLVGENINLEYTYNDELLTNKLDDMASKVPEAVVAPNYSIEDEELLIITKGKAGNSINKEELKQKILDEMSINNSTKELDIELIKVKPDPINIDDIYAKVHTEPKDAYYTKNPFQIYPHVNGVDFDLDAAREMLKEDKEEYEIELTITTPKVTTNQIGTEAFPDLLSSFTTRYDASNYPRSTNLTLAMNKLNGVVVAAGEVFSYNKTLGKRTVEDGYKEAGGYAGGRVVQTLAGGICQISSTLYDAVVYANLDIVERHNHMFLAGYVGAGKDATVVYGSLDFKFKNTRKYPIMIKTSIGNGVAKIDIYGIKEEVEYDVDIVTTVLSYTPFKVIYETDSSLKEGQQKVTQSGMNGCKSITYKVLNLNGAEVSRTVLSSDTYDPMNKIIKTGPKATAPTSTTTTNKDTTKDTTKDKNTESSTDKNNSTKPTTNNKETETDTNSNNSNNKNESTDKNTQTKDKVESTESKKEN